MIPIEIQGYETYIVSYSGGKDSTATLCWSLEHLPHERLRVVFADTTVEWPETYEYLDYIERELGVTIDRVQAGDKQLPPTRTGKARESMAHGKSFYEMVRLREKWPAPKYRYCTTYLKQWPLRLYALGYSNPVQIEGSRAQESRARSRYNQFDSSGSNGVHSAHLPAPPVIYRPILHWSEREVWDYLRVHRVLPNPVYNYATRCGCWCCIMGRRAEVFNFCRLHPEIAQRAANLEREIGHTWKERQSIGNLLVQAQVQLELFELSPRFAEVGI